MVSVYDLRKFYSLTVDVIVTKIYEIAEQIISSSNINEKIRYGLGISDLWITSGYLENRLKAMESLPTINDFLTSNISYDIYDLGSILKHCEIILSNQKEVFLAHEIETVMLIKKQLTKSIDYLKGGEIDYHFPPARDRAKRNSRRKISFKDKTLNICCNTMLVSDNGLYTAFLYKVLMDVEIPSMEICAYQILNNKNMPTEFVLDIAKQIWDESRHAKYLYNLFIEKGGRLENNSYKENAFQWDMKSSSLLELLIIQQILQESDSIETNLPIIKELALLKRFSEANSFNNINIDEASHIAIGNKWINYLVDKDKIKEKELLELILAIDTQQKYNWSQFGLSKNCHHNKIV